MGLKKLDLSNVKTVNGLSTEKENICQTHQLLTGPINFWIQVKKIEFEYRNQTCSYSSKKEKKKKLLLLNPLVKLVIE